MTDFSDRSPGLTSPPSRAFAITPHATDNLAIPTRGLMVTVAGNVTVVTVGGDTVTLPALQPGTQYAIRATAVRVEGTTATGIIGLA